VYICSQLSVFSALCKVGLEVKEEGIIKGHVMAIASEDHETVTEYEPCMPIPGHRSLSLRAHTTAIFVLSKYRVRCGIRGFGESGHLTEHLGTFTHRIVVGFERRISILDYIRVLHAY
jgi:hypothetical protein